MANRAYVAHRDEESPRIPERKRSHRARTETIARKQARAVKYAPVAVAR